MEKKLLNFFGASQRIETNKQKREKLQFFEDLKFYFGITALLLFLVGLLWWLYIQVKG
jgi:hypothetical protein